MNTTVGQIYRDYLGLTEGDKAAAASLTLAAALMENRASEPSPTTPLTGQTLTVNDAAARLKLSSKKIYQLCEAGQLRCFRAGRAIRIESEEIDRFKGEPPLARPSSPAAYRCLTCD